MNADDRERKVDEWLDAALSHYSDVQPRPGLEQRILANLEARQRTPLRWWRWAWVPAAAVLIVSAALLWNSQRRTEPVVVVTKAAPQKTEPAGLNPRIIPPVPAKHIRHAAAPRPMQLAVTRPELPKQEVFPSPEPLSEQERLALSFVRRAPAEALGVAQEQQAERQRARALETQSDTIQK